VERIKRSLEKRYVGKSILILGFGREGRSTYHLLMQLEVDIKLFIMDQNELAATEYLKEVKDVVTRVISSEDYLKGFDGFDYIFKTPGIPGYMLSKVSIEKITSQSQLFMEYLGDRTIGITGTKGKSTTSSLITYVLRNGGIKVKLIGNIGFPALESLLEDDGSCLYVYEMSSFQTEFLQVGPKIGVILNLFQEHLNNYIGYDAYQESKLQLFKAKAIHPNAQLLIYGCDNHILVEKIQALRDNNDHRHFNAFGQLSKNRMADPGYFIDNENIVRQDAKGDIEVVTSVNFSKKLLGQHNLINSLVVFPVVEKLIDEGLLKMECEEVISLIGEFKGLPHRLEDVGVYEEIRFYNDSISTIPEATMKAVEAIQNLGSLIIGGFDRKIGYTELAAYLDRYMETHKDFTLICMPETGHKVFSLMKHGDQCIKVSDMDEAISVAYKVTEKGKSCLLSPAASSYNQYKNFEDRGDHFVECIVKGVVSE